MEYRQCTASVCTLLIGCVATPVGTIGECRKRSQRVVYLLCLVALCPIMGAQDAERLYSLKHSLQEGYIA